MPEQISGGASPSGAVGRLSASLVALGRIRLELLAIEVQEEKERIAAMLVWAVVAAFLGCFALVFLSLFITVLLWDSHRLLALGGFAALFLVLAGIGVLRLRELFGAGSSLFQSTIAELREDSRALKQPPAAP
jgi:uncharacterized membrane protein YqjE